MQVTAKLDRLPRIGEIAAEPAPGGYSDRFVRNALLTEMPGLAIALITLFYLVSSLAGR